MIVGVLEVEGDRGHRLGGTAADLREVELNPIWEVDADAMLGTRRRASDRTGGGLEHVGESRCVLFGARYSRQTRCV